MASNEYSIRIRINSDGSIAAGELERVSRAAREMSRHLDAAGQSGRQAGQQIDGMTGSILKAEIASEIFQQLGARIADVADAADQWNNLQARIKLVSDSAEEAAASLDDVRRVAAATYTDVNATGDLYTTLARALKSLGDETTSVIGLTETVAQALALSGRGASENRSALIQFSQALASGVLRGDEFNSMMENGPRLMQALADGLGTTTGKLRAMAEEGKLTADIVVAAMSGQAEVIAKEFSTLPLTIGNALTNLGSAIKGLIGDFDDVNSTSTQVAKAIQVVSESLDTIATVAAAAGMGALVAGAANAAFAMKNLSAATAAAGIAAQQQVTVDRLAAASAANQAMANARVTASYSARAMAAFRVAQAELATAQASTAAAQAQVATAAGFRRLAATEALIVALRQQALAEANVAAATGAYVTAQNAASQAAIASSVAQNAAAVSAGFWARSATALGGAFGLLKSPMNAMMGAATVAIGIHLGLALREWGLGALYAADQGTVAAEAFEFLATAAEKASFHLKEIEQRSADKIKQIGEQTGLTFKSMEDMNVAIEKGALVWDQASQSWQRGAVTMEQARSAVTKLDAALQAQAVAIEKVAKAEDDAAKTAAQRRDLATNLAKTLGDEAGALKLTTAAREADAVAAARKLEVDKGLLANLEARFAGIQKEAEAGKGLAAFKQAELASLTDQIEKQKQAVAQSALMLESAQSAQLQAQYTAQTYGDQSGELEALTAAMAAAQAEHDRIAQAQQAGAVATDAMAAAQQRLNAANQDLVTAANAANAAESATIANLAQQALDAQASVDGLLAKVKDQAVTATELSQAQKALEVSTIAYNTAQTLANAGSQQAKSELDGLRTAMQASKTEVDALSARITANGNAREQLAAATARLNTLNREFDAAVRAAAGGSTQFAGALDMLGQSRNAAAAEVVSLTQKIAAGAVADNNAAGAATNLAVARARVNDATRDLIQSLELNLTQAENNTRAITEENALRQAQADKLRQSAGALDSVAAAALREQQAKAAALQSGQRQVGAMAKELEILRQLAAAKRQDADADGTRTFEERRSIAAAEDSVAAKEREIKAMAATLGIKSDVIDAISETSSALGGEAKSWEEVTRASVTYGEWVSKSGAVAQQEIADREALAVAVGNQAERVRELGQQLEGAQNYNTDFSPEFDSSGADQLQQELIDAKAKYEELRAALDQAAPPLEVEADTSQVDEAKVKVSELDGIKTFSDHKIDSNVDAILAEVQSLDGKDTSSTHTVYTRYVDQRHDGGPIVQRFATGGPAFQAPNYSTVPGSGNADTVPAALPVGSYVLRKRATRYYGPALLDALKNRVARTKASRPPARGRVPAMLTPGERLFGPLDASRIGFGLLNRLNRLQIPRERLRAGLANAMQPVQRFAAGGPVTAAAAPSTPTTREQVDINLQIGPRRVQVQGARDQAQALASALRELQRGL